MENPFTLEISYPTKGAGSQEWGQPDSDIEIAVGFEMDGAGTDMGSGDRDLTFSFGTRFKLDAVAARIKKEFPFVKRRVFDHTGGGKLPDLTVLD